MNRPVVIVDPISSGIELAPTFKARGVPAVAVSLQTADWPEFGAQMRKSDFLEILTDEPGLEERLKQLDPIAILPGTEEGIPLAERLTARLLPQLANDPQKVAHRAHKALMQRALEDAGVPTLKTHHTGSEEEAAHWLHTQGMTETSLILKPPMSSGSEMVFHVPAHGDWRKPFRHILTEPSVLTGVVSQTVVLQEEAMGTEFAVGTVSAQGRHYLTHLLEYHKTSVGGRKTVYDFVELVAYDPVRMQGLFEYVQHALDALGVRFGPTHTEVMLTAKGPRLIESSARMIGGPVVGFARAATGSSQADKLAEIYIDGEVKVPEYVHNRPVVPVFLKATRAGRLSNVEVLDAATRLPTFLQKHVWVKNGADVAQTVDYLTAIGIIALVGEREAIFADYQKIRAMEAELVFTTSPG
ncbi:MAG: ATP-grasp domain-containing protein [Myxococcota bacterium]